MDDNESPPVAVSVFFFQDDPQKSNRPALSRGPLLTAT
jgi:hypothetical protein